jgi:dTDP-4-amino-4,6-dideoxygalactose transaminase
MISYGKPSIDRNDINNVIKSLKSSNLTQGPFVKKFENNLSNYLGFKYCSVVSSGTSAMFLISQLLGWDKGDIIAMPPITFLSTASIIEQSNAKPLFVDINLENYCLCPDKLEAELIKDKKKRIKAVVITDFGGIPANWKKFYLLKKKYNLILINDQCHSLGSKYFSNKKYSSKYCDFSILSFHPVKTITTAEGGALLTNSKKMHIKSKLLRSHGIERTQKTYWKYKINFLGFNLRLSDINCALGISQLKKIKSFIIKRKNIASEYDEFFKKYTIFKIPRNDKIYSNSYHLYPLLIDFKKLNIKKDFLIKFFLKNKIKLQVHYPPVNLQPYYLKKYNIKKIDYKNSIDFYNREVSLPIYFDLKKNELTKVIKTFKNFLDTKHGIKK